jgi:hypothetical protein
MQFSVVAILAAFAASAYAIPTTRFNARACDVTGMYFRRRQDSYLVDHETNICLFE